jgi:hypothetical protein
LNRRIFTNAKLQVGGRGQGTELTGRGTMGRRRSSLDCSTIEEEEEEEEEEEYSLTERLPRHEDLMHFTKF